MTIMRNLLILVLLLALLAVTFFTRPNKADFERYIRENATVTNAQPDKSLGQQIAEQFKTVIAHAGKDATIAEFLNSVQYENDYLWTNVKSKDGQPLYTGAFGHWFKRKQPA